MSELQTLYVEEVMIRAYFHAKTRNKVQKFSDFLECFCDSSIKNVKQELIDFLSSEFGIRYQTDASLKISINKEEQENLASRLVKQGTPLVKAGLMQK